MSWVETLVTALRNVHRRPLRNTLATLGVVLGTAALVALLGLSRGIEREVVQSLGQHTPLSVVQVLPLAQQPGQRQPALGSADLRAVAALPGVRSALGVISAPATLHVRDRAPSGNVLGVSSPNGEVYHIAAGRAPSPSEADAVVLTPAGLRGLGLEAAAAVGRVVELELRRGGDNVQRRTLTAHVVGVADEDLPGLLALVPLQMAEEAQAWIATGDSDTFNDIRVAQQMTASLLLGGAGLAADVSQYSGIWAIAESPGQVREIGRAAERSGYNVVSAAGAADAVEQIFRAVDAGLVAITGVALGVAALGIANALLTSVSERTAEIGILKALGATDRVVEGVFLAEAAVLGLAGGLLGVAIGTLGALAAGALANQLVGARGFGVAVGPVVGPDLVGLGILLALGLSLLAGWVPARRAARLLPARALREE